MIIRLGLLVAASVAALAVKQTTKVVKSPTPPDSLEPKPLGDGQTQLEEIERGSGEEDRQLSFSDDSHAEDDVGDAEENGNVNDEEEEKEEVKLISSEIKLPSNMSRFSLEYAEMLPEFESLLSGEIDLPYSRDRFDMDRRKDDNEKDRQYQAEMANNANELESLLSLVRELEEREVKLEGELLEYYGLKDQ